MMRMSGFVLIGSLLLAGSATAQTADVGETSPQDRKHVEALFQAQNSSQETLTQDASQKTLTREQIEAYRSSEGGWGKAFKQMQADGYFEGYKNFGQVISSSKTGKIGSETQSAKAKEHKANNLKIDKPRKAQKLRRVTRVNRPNRPKRPKRR